MFVKREVGRATMAPVTDWARPLDTTPAAAAVQIAVYRRLGGSARVAIAFRLGTLARETALAGIRRRHPEYDDGRARRALHRLLLGDVLMREAYPDEALVDP